MLPPPAITTRRAGASSRRISFITDADILARGEEEHLVAVLDDGVALGLDALARPIDGGDPRIGGRNVLAQRAQRLADERPALKRADADQPHAAIREIEHLQRAGVADQARDVLRDELLGADPHVHRDRVLAEQRSRSVYVAERTRAIFFGVRYSVQAMWQANMLTSSLLVSATRMSVRAMPAASRIRGLAGIAADGADIEPILQVAQDLLVRCRRR